jgi:hypothetical protein
MSLRRDGGNRGRPGSGAHDLDGWPVLSLMLRQIGGPMKPTVVPIVIAVSSMMTGLAERWPAARFR